VHGAQQATLRPAGSLAPGVVIRLDDYRVAVRPTPLVGDGGWLLIASTTTLMLVLSVWLLLA